MSTEEKKSALDKKIREHAEEIHRKIIDELEKTLDQFFEKNHFLMENGSCYRYTDKIMSFATSDYEKERVLQRIEAHELDELFKQLDIK